MQTITYKGYSEIYKFFIIVFMCCNILINYLLLILPIMDPGRDANILGVSLTFPKNKKYHKIIHSEPDKKPYFIITTYYRITKIKYSYSMFVMRERHTLFQRMLVGHISI